MVRGVSGMMGGSVAEPARSESLDSVVLIWVTYTFTSSKSVLMLGIEESVRIVDDLKHKKVLE